MGSVTRRGWEEWSRQTGTIGVGEKGLEHRNEGTGVTWKGYRDTASVEKGEHPWWRDAVLCKSVLFLGAMCCPFAYRMMKR